MVPPSLSIPGMEGHDFTPPSMDVTVPILRGLVNLVSRQTAVDDNVGDTMGIAQVTTSTEGLEWVGIVDTVILSLTILGSSSILISMLVLEYRGRPSTTRMRIVQALILSDLMLGLTGLIGSAMELAGNELRAGTSSCNGLGLMLVVILWTEHFWTLTLAVVTYMILIYPLNYFTTLIERRWYWLWGFIWVTSFGIGIIGYEVYGYFPSGGICYYGSNAGLYGELIQFIPRALVFVIITCLYARLFIFLRRPDHIRSSFSDGSANLQGAHAHGIAGGHLPLKRSSFGSFVRHRKISELLKGRSTWMEHEVKPTITRVETRMSEKRPPRRKSLAPSIDGNGNANGNEDGFGGGIAASDSPHVRGIKDYAFKEKHHNHLSQHDEQDEDDIIQNGGVSPRSNQHRKLSNPYGFGTGTINGGLSPLEEEANGGASPRCITPAPTPSEDVPREIPPWEKVNLPIFEIDGQRYGGMACNTSNNTTSGSSSLWGNWKGLTGGSHRSGKGDGHNRKRPSTGTTTGDNSSIRTDRVRSGSNSDKDRDRNPRRQNTSSISNNSTTAPNSPPGSPGFGGGSNILRLDSTFSSDGDISFNNTSQRDKDSTTGYFVEGGGGGPAGNTQRGRLSITEPTRFPRESRSSSLGERDRDRLRKMSAISSPLTEEYHPSITSSSPDMEAPSPTIADQDRQVDDTRTRVDFDMSVTVLSEKEKQDDYVPKENVVKEKESSFDPIRREDGKLLDVEVTAGDGRSRASQSHPGGVEVEDQGFDEDDDLWDFSRMLAAGHPDGEDYHRNGSQARGGVEETIEFVEESMASYLNRKTALLMLWFPLGYVLLFSVSLVRIVYDLAGNPPPALRALSRWFIFAQGILDALIYGLVEWHTKRVVRKRVRKGTFSPGASASGTGGGSALHHAIRSWRGSHSQHGNTSATGPSRAAAAFRPPPNSASHTPTASFIPNFSAAGRFSPIPSPTGSPREVEKTHDPQSLMQALDGLKISRDGMVSPEVAGGLGVGERKDSVTNSDSSGSAASGGSSGHPMISSGKSPSS